VLDTKFLEGVYENIPQICLQTFIMFTVSVEHGGFALSIFVSVVISLVSVSGVLVMLVDRGKVRKASLGPRERNPWFVRWTARVLAVVLESDMVHSGRAQEAMKSLVNYSVSDRVRGLSLPVYLLLLPLLPLLPRHLMIS
jgi:hypothetical protein